MRNLAAFRGLRFSRLGSLRASTPLALLFASQEPGIWLDPSDMSTLFQDTAGTTPVTAAGQSVGLMLDKSKGLALGPELVTNGGFESSVNGWLGSGAAISSVAGKLRVLATAIGGSASQTINTVVGRSYRVAVTGVNNVSGHAWDIGFSGVFYPATAISNAANGSYEFIVVASAATTTINLRTRFSASAVVDFDNISVRELPGNHATQATAASRPTYQVDSGGRGYLSFDGVDDFLVTPTITSGVDKVQVFAGVRKLSDATQGCVLAIGLNGGTPGVNSESGLLLAPGAAAANTYFWRASGTLTGVQATASGYAAPHSAVLSAEADITSDLQRLRVNGGAASLGSGDLGTGAFGTGLIVYIGRRGGTTLPFNGRIYGLITRFGANLNESQIKYVESLLAQKTGVTL